MKKKFLLVISLAVLVICFTGCGSNTGTDTTADYRTEFTEDEITNGYASFEIEKNLKVDADITKPEKYEKGLSSYYMDHFFESCEGERKKLEQTPTVFHKDYNKFSKWLHEFLDGKLDKKTFQIDFSSVNLDTKLKASDGSYDIHVEWSSNDEEYESGDAVYCPFLVMDKKGKETSDMALYVLDMMEKKPDQLPDFVKDADGQAKKYKKWVEDLTGTGLCDTYDVVPMTGELAEELNQGVGGTLLQEPAQDYVTYVFYPDVDGLPYKEYTAGYVLKGDEKASALAKMSSLDNTHLVGLPAHAQKICVDKDGVTGAQISNIRYPSKVYKKDQKIVSPNVVLKAVKECYDKQVLLTELTVKSVELVYIGYFSSAEDGAIQPVITPVWVANVYNPSRMSTEQIICDAFTGTVYKESKK